MSAIPGAVPVPPDDPAFDDAVATTSTALGLDVRRVLSPGTWSVWQADGPAHVVFTAEGLRALELLGAGDRGDFFGALAGLLEVAEAWDEADEDR